MSRGPMGRNGQFHGKMQKPDGKSLKRLMSYLLKYKARFAVVLVCIFISAFVGVAASMFLQVLIDDFIIPLKETVNPVFTELLRAIIVMGLYSRCCRKFGFQQNNGNHCSGCA